ncbi:HAD family hydrolase [Laceyella sacchari]|uniref:HAD family hydrolase n=1 Tax=Laceyella sacchari TaxID=37482 RepID=A0ABY5U3K9_LACSH|nr:HAD family hydrolase [Laceyella sacchari]TCW40578.1 FMN phosphatase YigB (HAD superfamily) [Laceyella sacchari]UWE04229.1 HAD family hydrolase [Laceyella sacchari]
MIKACLFDLDGTLLPMDTEAFVNVYLGALAPQVAHVIPPDKLVKMIWHATEEMIKNTDEQLTNEQVFERTFLEVSKVSKEEIWPVFDRFYREEFPKLQTHVGREPLMREVVQAALERGYKVAVATNPVFPKEAIWERMRWAGVDDLPFSLVTVYEEMHFCKPQPCYYLEVADGLGVKPEECVMIGNDMQEDMVASTVGMKTFYLQQHRIDRGQPVYPFDMEGTAAELLSAIREGKELFAAEALKVR